jgi:hypothetical protein
MKRLGFLALLAGAAPLASAQDTVKLLPTRLEMPRRIGPMYLQGEPHKFSPAELGYGYQYDGAGLSLTVYVYDGGIADIPDGGDTTPTCMQFEQAKQDVSRAGYADVTLKSQQLARLAPPADLPLAREAVFEFERGGKPTISYLWITAVNKNFVKMRFSLDARLRDEVPEARRSVLSALGTAMQPQLQPPAPKPQSGENSEEKIEEKKGPATQLMIGVTDTDDMPAALMYLMVLSGMTEGPPEQLPVCGGPLVPSFETDVEAYRGVVTVEREGATSKLGKRLADIEAAGFLEEFVWSDLHREEWGTTPPAGLELDNYQPWRKKNLKRFKAPSLGSVAIDQPRPMPIEPVEAP